MTGGKTIACPSCGGTVAVRAAGYTVTLACHYCGALLDVANPDVRLIAAYGEAVAQLPLPLGSRGTLFGVEWEAIGWQERQSSDAVWTEYLLFNPYAGYRWLVHAEGQWQFGAMLVDQPGRIADDQVVWRGRTFRLSERPDRVVTNRVLGEFYWRVQAGEEVGAAAYADGDDTLSLEHNADEINWTRLIALRPSAVRNAFTHPLSEGGGPGDAAPAPYGLWTRWSDLPFYTDDDARRMTMIATAAIIIVLCAMALLGHVAQSIDNKLTVRVDGPPVELTLGTITITRPTQAVRVQAVADGALINDWVDLDYALVNRSTQQAIRAEGTIEYYSGRDTDGSIWTEGSHVATIAIASVPRGSYDVVAQAQAHHWSDPKTAAATTGATPSGWETVMGDTHDIWLSAEVGGMEWGVFWTVLALIATPPALLVYWRARRGQWS